MTKRTATNSDTPPSDATNTDPNPSVGSSVADGGVSASEVNTTESGAANATQAPQGATAGATNSDDETPRRGRRRPVGSRRKVETNNTQTDTPFTPPTQQAATPGLEADEIMMSPKEAAEMLVELLDGGWSGYIQLRHGGWLQNDGLVAYLLEQGVDARSMAELDDKAKKRLEKALVRYLENNPIKMTPLQNLAAAMVMTFGVRVATLEKIRWEGIKAQRQRNAGETSE